MSVGQMSVMCVNYTMSVGQMSVMCVNYTMSVGELSVMLLAREFCWPNAHYIYWLHIHNVCWSNACFLPIISIGQMSFAKCL